MTLDLHTLHYASAASRCAYVIVFFVIALGYRQQTFLWQWMGAMGASMAGSLIMMSVPPEDLPPIGVTVIVYCLYSTSLVLSWTGLRSFFERPVNARLSLGLIALPGFLYPALLYLGVSTRFGLAAVFACCLGIALLAAYETVRVPAKGERLWSQYIESVAFGFYALVFVASIGMLIRTDLPIASAESARISMIMDQILGVFVYFGYIAMAAERANRTLLRLAETDPLTGLLNRRGLKQILLRGLSRSSRSVGAVLILDIDHFKSINDRYGHEAGDAVLTAVAMRMKAAVRAKDLVARWGGEEFLVMLADADPQQIDVVAERLRASVAAQPFRLASEIVPVTISIGATMMAPDDATFEEATQRADAALYDAKRNGRDRVCWKPIDASTGRTRDADRQRFTLQSSLMPKLDAFDPSRFARTTAE